MYEPPFHPSYGSNSTITVLLEGWLWHCIAYKGWYAIKQRNWNWTSLPWLPGPLWSEVVAPDRVRSRGQIELNRVLTVNWIVWNRTVFKFNYVFALDITETSYLWEKNWFKLVWKIFIYLIYMYKKDLSLKTTYNGWYAIKANQTFRWNINLL